MGGTIVILLVGTFLVAWIAPPNTNDALQYHLSRVAHWAQQASLEHFATPIPRQIWMPPWAEMAMLHLYLLAGGDWLVNMVQWLALVGCLVAVGEIVRQLGAGRSGQSVEFGHFPSKSSTTYQIDIQEFRMQLLAFFF